MHAFLSDIGDGGHATDGWDAFGGDARKAAEARHSMAALAEASRILAESEGAAPNESRLMDDVAFISVPSDGRFEADGSHPSVCECWACSLERMADSLAAILPELDRLGDVASWDECTHSHNHSDGFPLCDDARMIRRNLAELRRMEGR